jgi:ABC-type dipeptide/oligopeptide/nickel transport system ATPase subunit
MLLILKFNVITEGRLSVYDIELKSELSDDVKFIYDVETAMLNPFDKKGWWLDKSPTIANTVAKSNKKEKIVKLVKAVDWKSIGLEWVNKIESADILELKAESDKP